MFRAAHPMFSDGPFPCPDGPPPDEASDYYKGSLLKINNHKPTAWSQNHARGANFYDQKTVHRSEMPSQFDEVQWQWQWQ